MSIHERVLCICGDAWARHDTTSPGKMPCLVIGCRCTAFVARAKDGHAPVPVTADTLAATPTAEQGSDLERAVVVHYLRTWAGKLDDRPRRDLVLNLAYAIERGIPYRLAHEAPGLEEIALAATPREAAPHDAAVKKMREALETIFEFAGRPKSIPDEIAIAVLDLARKVRP
jgi:hypothetical protein